MREKGKRASFLKPRHSTIDHCVTLGYLEEKIWDKQGETTQFSLVYFKKSFGTIPRAKLQRKMKYLGIPDGYRVTIHKLYQNFRVKIKTSEAMLECFGSDFVIK